MVGQRAYKRGVDTDYGRKTDTRILQEEKTKRNAIQTAPFWDATGHGFQRILWGV